MKMYEVSDFIIANPEAIVQFMTTSSFLDRPFTYCCTVQELYDDWTEEANHCPENGDMILMCTFYVDDKAYPIDPGEYVLRKVEKYFDGPDPIGKTHIREGVVARIVNRPNIAVYKHKNFSFKVLEGIAKDEAVVPDMEEAQDEMPV